MSLCAQTYIAAVSRAEQLRHEQIEIEREQTADAHTSRARIIML
jgi:hypothetical protein